MTAISSVALRRARRIISEVTAASSVRYVSRSSSSYSATASISWWWYSSACSRSSSGISISSILMPRSSAQTTAFMSITSTTPRKCSSCPTGSCTGTGWAPSRSTIDWTEPKKSAPTRSILLMKATRGTRYRSAWRQTVSDCGSTPATESNTAIAPSRTRRLRSTSTVKSTCPGVSIMLIRKSRQNAVVAADVIVIPRSCSCAIQSMTAAPSCTSPILWVRPVKYRIRSVVVVLPASMCAMIPMFRTFSSAILSPATVAVFSAIGGPCYHL